MQVRLTPENTKKVRILAAELDQSVPETVNEIIRDIKPDEHVAAALDKRCENNPTNAEVSHAAPPAASDKPTAQRGGVALH